ncbi:MAG TPA: hypothetical protein DCZ69_18820 [Syntrophobacteraceae bacterium]|nr:hypothetical protein [Syntrophobacteraceae bacterium]
MKSVDGTCYLHPRGSLERVHKRRSTTLATQPNCEVVVKDDPASRILADVQRVSEILSPAKEGVSRKRRGLCSLKVLFLWMMFLTWNLLPVPAPLGEEPGKPWEGDRGWQSTALFDHMAVHTIRLVDDRGGPLALSVKIAKDPRERAAGFQNIGPEVIQNSLILFVFPETLFTRFHMENVNAPLDIAFIGESGEIIDIQQMQVNRPGRSLTYGPNRPFRYALEARAGFFADHHISPGKALLEFP